MTKVRLLVLIFSAFLALSGSAQNPNDWINFSQDYYRIPVAKAGIYRLTYNDLQAAGFPVGSVDPRFIQIYHRGIEQAITVQGQADAQLNPGDYLEFYGQRNDGNRDGLLYQPASLQPHTYYNLFSDTSAYFLTWTSVPPAGKRMNSFSENNVTGIQKETSHTNQELNLYVSEYSGGNSVSAGEIQNSFFDEGEGWTDAVICTQNSGCLGLKDYLITNLLTGVPAAGIPRLEILLVGRDELSHHTEVLVGPNSGSLRLVDARNFENFQTQRVIVDLNWSDIGADGKMTVEVKALGVGGFRERISVSYCKVTFPQDFNVTGQTSKSVNLNPNPAGKSYIELTNPAANLRIWDVTDVNNLSTIGTNSNPGILSAVVSNTISSRMLFVSNEIVTPVIHHVTFQHFNPSSVNFLIVTHSSLLTAAQSYGAYRATSAGGGFSVLTVTMDQLYNQFNYGESSPLAIYQFVKWMAENGSPTYLFLVGKGRDVSIGYERHPAGSKDLVPSAGLPASDMLFSTAILGSGSVPALSTGRLSASTSSQVIAYLDKVKEIEASPLSDPWMKKGLHLSGGIALEPINELDEFRQYLDGFKDIAEGKYWGAHVSTIAKHDATAVEQINIADEVNSGVNLITFFGHSSPGTIDIDIGFVTDPALGYNNPGKYPVFLINGCNAGNAFANGVSFGEDWMLAAGRGARGFIAHSSFGFTSTLQSYSDLFYRTAFADSAFIKKGVGDVQREVTRKYMQTYGTDMVNLSQAQQMILLGDPAVRLFGTATPDYATNDAAVSLISLDGKPVTALSDSFAIKVIVKNLGAYTGGTLPVRVIRTFNDNTSTTYDSVFTAPSYEDTLIYRLRKEKANGYGINRFTVILDFNHAIPELNESNNTAVLNKLIQLGGTKNLVPYPYAIVSQPSVDLVWQGTDLLSGSRSFQVELDTASDFTSSYLKHAVVSGKTLANFVVNLLTNDSLVYYWRTKLDQPRPEESPDWVVSSFTFISNSPEGWVQRKFGQLFENEFSGLVRDEGSKGLNFVETYSSLFVKTFGSANPALNTDVSVKINNAEYNLATQGQPCRSNTLNLIAFNKTSLVPYAGLPFSFQDVRTCGREPQVINSFTLSEMQTGLGDDVSALIDAISASDSVLLFSIGNVNYSSWPAAMKSKLHELGILESQLSGLQDGDPVVILARKGSPAGTARVFAATGVPANAQALQVAEDITGRYTSGSMKSVVIGPALHWSKLIPKVHQVQASDAWRFILYGVKYNGSKDLLMDNLSGEVDLSGIDAAQYPNLKLELYSEDEVNLDPVQLSQWMVLYDPVPEGVLLFSGPAGPVTVGEGQAWSSDYKFANISPKAFSDSLTVNFGIINPAKGIKENSSFRIAAPAPGDTTSFSISTQTMGKAGANNVGVYVNPMILPEQFYENNVADLEGYLVVQADNVGPVVDVTVDGRYLNNGDFVSPNPRIIIKVFDENMFVFKADTSGMTVILTYPCDDLHCPGTRIYFTRNDIQWFPATAESPFRIEFKPMSLPGGEYHLFVQASDASGNLGGPEPYEVTFVVESESTLTFQSVFPNPSSDVFVFSFVLTGNTLPDDFKLELFAPDGRTLQDIGPSALNSFHIGTNQLVWDARDAGGNQLPAGLYIYRLQIGVDRTHLNRSGKLLVVR